MSLFLVFNILLWIEFGAYGGVITEGVNVTLALVVLIQVIKYRKKLGGNTNESSLSCRRRLKKGNQILRNMERTTINELGTVELYNY